MRLPAPPPPQLTLLAFLVTAAIAGWMGFDLAWHYNSTSAKSGLPETESFPSLEDLLKSRDSGPMFGQPSVESSPLMPIELNKRPKPQFDSSNTLTPIAPEAASSEPEPSPNPEILTPESEPQPSSSPTSEPEPQSSASDNPEPQADTIAPETVPESVPEVAPLPPEPPRNSPPAAAPPLAEATQTSPPPEPEAQTPALPAEGSTQPAFPIQGGSNSDSSIAPGPSAVAEPTVPFPEPATN